MVFCDKLRARRHYRWEGAVKAKDQAQQFGDLLLVGGLYDFPVSKADLKSLSSMEHTSALATASLMANALSAFRLPSSSRSR